MIKFWSWACPVALALSLASMQLMLGSDLLKSQIFDAQHYIYCCKLFWHLSEAPLLAATSLRLNGPVMPLLSCLASLCGGLLADGNIVVTPFVVIMTLVYAITVALVAGFTGWLSKSPIWALIAGMAYALYLPAQLAATLFLSETPTALLLLAVIWAQVMVLAFERLKKYRQAQVAAVSCGLMVATIAMVKTALLPGVLLVTLALFVYLPRLQRWIISSLVLCGAGLVFLSYASCLYTLSGCFELLPSRDPAMNMAVGCDYEVDAWECKPMPFITYQGTFQKPLITLSQSIKTSTLGFCQLTTNKALRAWDMPWLSCRRVIFGWPDLLPRIQHTLVVALAASMILVTACGIRLTRFMTCRNLALAGLIVMVMSHFVFVLFESQPRYMFTAMPLLVVLSCGALARLSIRRRVVVFLIAMSFAVVLYLLSDRQGPIANQPEPIRGCTLKMTQESKSSGNAPYLIFSARDFDPGLPVNLQINEDKLQTSAEPLVTASDFEYKPIVEDMSATVCRARELKGPADLWDWYAIALPRNVLLTNSIKQGLIQVSPISIAFSINKDFYCQTSVLSPSGMITMPALYYRSLSRLESSPDGLDLRPPVELKLGSRASLNQSLNQSKRVPLIFYATKDSRLAHNDRWTLYPVRDVTLMESSK